jgi:hypothetical protein
MSKVLKAVAPYNKAVMPLLVAVVLGVLAKFGVTEDMTVTDAVTLLATSVVVWAVPNKKVK